MILLLQSALAGGYFYSDSGVIANARGGAWVAGANTQFAQYYNPAGLIRVRQPTLNLGLSMVQQHIGFERLTADGQTLPEAVNQAPPFMVPQGGFTFPIGKRFAMAVGFVSPFAGSSDYDPAGAQRYSIIESGVYQFSYGPSVAWQPFDFVTVGMGLKVETLIIEQRLAVSATGVDNPGGDVGVFARASDLFTPNVNFGLLIEPVPALSIGLGIQPSTRFQAKGDIELDLTDSSLASFVDKPLYRDGNCSIGPEDPACSSEDGITLDIDLPTVVRVGVAVRPLPQLEIEAAFVWEDWSRLEQITLGDVDPTIEVFGSPTEIPSEFELPAGLRDTFSYRLGGHYKVGDDLILRAGGFYETGSKQDPQLSVSLVDPNKFQVGGGLSILPRGGRVQLDGTLSGVFFGRRTITNSESDQVFLDVLNNGADPVVVGNGNYRSTGWIVALQTQFFLSRREAI